MPEVANTTDSRRSIAKCDASQYVGFGKVYRLENRYDRIGNQRIYIQVNSQNVRKLRTLDCYCRDSVFRGNLYGGILRIRSGNTLPDGL